jgi:hypothetical protein
LTVALLDIQPPAVRREIEEEAEALLRFAEPDASSSHVIIRT